MDGHGGGGGGDQLDRCRLPPQSSINQATLGIEEIEANRPAGSCGYTVTVSSLVTSRVHHNNSPGQRLHDELHVSVPRHDPLQAQAQLGVRLAVESYVANIFPPCIRYFHLSTAW